MSQEQTLWQGRWHYDVLPEKSFHDDLGEFSTFGIISSNRIEFVHDVSVDREIVTWMVELFNKYQLSPIHLKEAVEQLLP